MDCKCTSCNIRHLIFQTSDGHKHSNANIHFPGIVEDPGNVGCFYCLHAHTRRLVSALNNKHRQVFVLIYKLNNLQRLRQSLKEVNMISWQMF